LEIVAWPIMRPDWDTEIFRCHRERSLALLLRTGTFRCRSFERSVI
jgi:hypothetical protein